ncbi:hypothetical protein [Blastococcus brunescens]|uniref:Uncharacterized protein n=1 Tax=Blastococcus brunescens TaxID=1564165 RepID=A0ABZ1AYB2_9ACTN|nr:hypothetical protein [Blastococcus sp. BMG 8361]WRL62628.1 hypothetical protein U6N30_22135 [Blastococcus sp. BMG 8361]
MEPALQPVGEVAVVAAGFVAAAVLMLAAGRTDRPRPWRLLAAAPLFPAVGALAAALVQPADAVDLAVIRWVPTVPGYLIAIVAILGLVDRGRLRARPRLVVEVAQFLFACLVVVSLLVVGPDGAWSALALQERVVLGAAVLTTSATMAAALTILGVIEARRRTMAVVLLAGPRCSPSGGDSARRRCSPAPSSRSRPPGCPSPRACCCWLSPSSSTDGRRPGTPTARDGGPSTSARCCRTSPCSPPRAPRAPSR